MELSKKGGFIGRMSLRELRHFAGFSLETGIHTVPMGAG
jgi:hypothetical protein